MWVWQTCRLLLAPSSEMTGACPCCFFFTSLILYHEWNKIYIYIAYCICIYLYQPWSHAVVAIKITLHFAINHDYSLLYMYIYIAYCICIYIYSLLPPLQPSSISNLQTHELSTKMADRYNIQIGEKCPNVYKLPSTPSLQQNNVPSWNLMFSSKHFEVWTKLVVEEVFNLEEPTVCTVKACGKPHFFSLLEAGMQRKRREFDSNRSSRALFSALFTGSQQHYSHNSSI